MRRAALFYGSLVALIFYPFFLFGEVFVPGDFLSFIYPWKAHDSTFPHNIELFDVAVFFYPQDVFLNQSLKMGTIPFWNPHIFSGHPIVASGQSGFLYPPRLLLHFLFSAGVAKTWFQLFHLFGMGLGMYWFLKVKKFDDFPAILGGVCWMGNTHVTSWLEFEHIGVAGMYLPLLLVAFEKGLQGSRYGWLWLPVLGALSLHSGHLQSNLYSGLVFLIYVMIRLIQTGERGQWLKFAAVGALTIGLAGPTIFPFLSFLSQSQRLTLDPSANAASLGSLLFSLLCPDLFGNPANGFMLNRCEANLIYPEFACFAGSVPLIFFLSARGKEARFLQGTAGVGLFFAAATFGLTLPLLGRFVPGRILFLVMFCVAYGACLGAQQWSSGDSSRYVAMTLGGLWLLLLGVLAYLVLIRPELVADWWQAQPRAVKIPPLDVERTQFVEALRGAYLWNPQLLFPLVAYGLFLFKPKKEALLLITAIELVWFAAGFNTSVPKAQLRPPTPEIQMLSESQGRVISIGCANYNTLNPYGASLINGYESLVPKRYYFLLSQVEQPLPMRSLALSKVDSPILDALSLEYALLPPHRELESERWELVREDEGGKIYRNPGALPRAILIGHVQPLQSIDQLKSFEPSQTAFVSQPPPNGLAPGRGQIKWLLDTPNELQLTVESETTQLLLLTDAYFDGWECFIDGRQVPVFPVNIGSRGVYITKGSHRVEFRFRPPALTWGLGAALLSILILLGGAIVLRQKASKL